jgi:RNA polymerase sigma-70 factor (ECF subfamily)
MSDQNMGRKDAPDLDDALVQNARQGEAAALETIYNAYARRVYRYFLSRVADHEDAEDLTTQTFVSVIEALPRYQHRSQFTAWLFQIAHSKAMDFFRRNNSKARKEAETKGMVFDETLERIVQNQTIETLRLLIQMLDEDERELLRLRFVVDLTYLEIAELLGRREDAVRKSVNRILERLHAEMEAKHV